MLHQKELNKIKPFRVFRFGFGAVLVPLEKTANKKSPTDRSRWGYLDWSHQK